MSTTREMVYRLWRRLENGNIPDDSKFTYRELRGYIRSGIAEGLKTNYFEQSNLEEYKYRDSSVAFTYVADIETDADTDERYVVLQGKSISMAGNRFETVSSTNQSSRWGVTYIPIRGEEAFLRKKQPTIPCVVMYYKEDGKLKFLNEDPKDKKVKITEKYSIPNDDDANLTLPEELENAAMTTALRLMGLIQFPSDRENNGVPLT